MAGNLASVTNSSSRQPLLATLQTMNIKNNKKELSPKQREELLNALKARFEKNLNRHKGLDWAKVQARLEANAGKTVVAR